MSEPAVSASDAPVADWGNALETGRPPQTLTQLAWQRFRRHRMAMAGAVLLLLMVLYVTAGTLFLDEADANYNDLSRTLQPPSAQHPFGTDGTGRDIMARTIYGARFR